MKSKRRGISGRLVDARNLLKRVLLGQEIKDGNQQSGRHRTEKRLLSERLESRQMLAGDGEFFATTGSDDLNTIDPALVAAPAHSALPQFNSTAQSTPDPTAGLVGEGEPTDDLVAFARALTDAGVRYFGSEDCPACLQQRQLFQDGSSELEFIDVTAADGSLNSIGQAEGIQAFPTWEFPDNTRFEGVLSLQEISQRSGVAIPQGETPTFASISSPQVRIGSPLHIPIDAYDPDGDPLTVTVEVADPSLLEATVLSGNRSLSLNVANYGEMLFELFEQRAPRPTGRLIELAESGFYEDVIFHRVIDQFVIQGGDPTGTGTGGSTLGDFDDQYHPDLQHNRDGILSYAKTVDDTNDSQFFVTEVPTRNLDFNHSIAGILVEGESVREAISNVQTSGSDRPVNDIVIESANVITDNENSVIMLRALTDTPATTSITVTVTDSDGLSFSDTFTVNILEDNANGTPYLNDIPTPASVPNNETLNFTVSSIDVEQDPVDYIVQANNPSEATVSVDQDTGEVTVNAVNSFVGTTNVTVNVVAEGQTSLNSSITDTQVVPVTFTETAVTAPTGISLLSSSDSGTSDSDRITRTAEMTFEVTGVTAGSNVRLFVNDAEVGIGLATTNVVQITTNNIAALGDGTYSVTATQTINNVASEPSSPVVITFDNTAPIPFQINDLPPNANIGSEFVANVNHPEEGNGITYSLSNAPVGMEINSDTGVIRFTPVASQEGDQSFTVDVTDVAGNVRSETFSIEVEQAADGAVRLGLLDTDGNAIDTVSVGQQFQVQFFADDLRTGSAIEGVFAAYIDLLFDSNLVEPVPGEQIVFGGTEQNDRINNVPVGTIGDGIIDELGALYDGTTASNRRSSLVATIQMRAIASGTALFTTNPADDQGEPFLIFNSTDISNRVTPESVSYGSAELTISNGFTIADDSFSINEDAVNAELDVLQNDTINDNNLTLTITEVGTPSQGGTVSIVGSGLQYSPASDFNGAETFTYTVRDSNGGVDSATVTVSVLGVNDPPTAVADRFTVTQDSTDNSLDVLANDSQLPDSGETLQVDSVGTTTAGGTVTIASDGQSVIYTPATGFTGTDTFTYTLTDGTDTNGPVTVTVDVQEGNIPPTAVDDTFSLVEDAAEAEFDVLQNDSTDDPQNPGETIALDSVGTSSNGSTIRLNDAGDRLVYAPAADFFGTESISYTIRDSNGATATATVTFNVTGTNDPPPADGVSVSVVTDSSENVVVTLDSIGTNVDGTEAVTILSVGETSGSGTATLVGEVILYTPATGFEGTETFTYTTRDPDGLTSEGTVTVTVQNFSPRTISVNYSANGLAVNDMEVTLRGTSDFETEELVRTARVNTETNTVSFEDLPPGEYEIVVPAVPFFSGAQQEQTIPVSSGLSDGDTTVESDLGSLLPQFISLQDFLGSAPQQSVLAAVLPGRSHSVLVASNNLTDVSDPVASLNDAGNEVTVDVNDDAGSAMSAALTLDNENVQVRGESDNFRLLRINLDPETVSYSSGSSSASLPAAEGEPSADPASPVDTAPLTQPAGTLPSDLTSGLPGDQSQDDDDDEDELLSQESSL